MAQSEGDMSIERFEELLDQLGPDLKNWPEEQVAAALALLSISQDAQDSLRLAASIPKLAKASPAPKAPASLVNRIMTKVKK
nr:hypothetical protein [uncultured Cohaesibacter sp.]